MARPQKQTVEYFSHDADASESRTLSILFNQFGHEGISAWWLLLERLSKTRNHVISTNNGEDIEFLAAKMHFKPERLKEILSKMAELDAIDRELFNGGVVWCQHFVDRLESVYRYRKQDLPSKPQLPIKETGLLGKETKLLNLEIPQSKVKDSRVKDIKESKEKKPYGEFKNVLLSDEEYARLVGIFGEPGTRQKIEDLSQGIASKGYKYKSHYAAILSWDRMEKKRRGLAGTHDRRLPTDLAAANAAYLERKRGLANG